MTRIPLRLLVVGFALALVAAGCTGDDSDRTAATTAGSSTTVASSTTEPTVGPSGPRPPVADAPAVPMALDEQSGVLVAIVEDQTWTLDLETSTWAQRSAAAFDSSRWFWTRLVYDPGADRTVAVTEEGATYAYDADSDTWTQRSSLPEPGFPGVAALDTRRDRIVVLAGPAGALRAWSYAVADDRWEEIVQAGPAPTDSSPLLVGYAPTVDAFVTVTGRGGGGSAPTPVRTDTFAAETGTWEAVDTDTPGLFFAYGDLSSGTEMTYASVTDRLIVFTDALVAEYDPVEHDWATFTAPDTVLEDGMAVGPFARLGSTLVYDSVNDRVLMYGGNVRTADGWRLLDDLWSYDPIRHDWSLLLDDTQSVAAF
jgi:hypothetical protein